MIESTQAHEGHRERLRLRAQNEGLENFEPHELLEYLLCYAIPRQDVNGLAHVLLERFGSVERVLHAETPELTGVPGVGARTAEFLMRVGEAADAYLCLRLEDRPLLQNFLQVFRHALKLNRGLVPPSTHQLLMDFNGRLVYGREICPSRAWGEPETMREALSDALSLRARSALLLEFIGNMHADPETYEIEHAEAYAYTLHAAGSELLDVVLIGEGGITSMRQAGLLPDHTADDVARSIRENYLREFPDAREIHQMYLKELGEDGAVDTN